MPVLTTLRQSPAYLYVKTYCLCATISLFQAAPVSSRLPQIAEKVHSNKSGNAIVRLRAEPRSIPGNPTKASSLLNIGDLSPVTSGQLTSPEPSEPSPKRSRVAKVLERWYQRAVDLASIKQLLHQDDKDFRTYPELAWDAKVRHSSSIHPDERAFISLRQRKISSQGANSLHSFLSLPEDEKVDPQDVPLIALGGSGGGYRAMYGFVAFISASKKLGLWDCLTWTAGVSGSCWTIAAYYTIANHDASKLLKQYLAVARERTHPMSVSALEIVVRSKKGVYFLIGPLIRKVRSGIIGLGVMDLYGTLTTTYQLLSREPGARLSRATFQFSKVWTRSGLDQALEPMPIFTAVRRAPKDSAGVKPHTDSSLSKGQPPSQALTQHQTNVFPSIQLRLSQDPKPNTTARATGPPDSSLSKGFFQWFEISPLEIGSPDVNAYVPTWSWGRSFVSGTSVGRPPEQSLSLLLGQCTSAPAGPLTGYISALLASLPKRTVMSRLLLLLNDFVRMKKWGRLWGNPIRAGHDPNPFYGHNNRSQAKIGKKWESQGRIRLMDSGMSNNLPSHVLARPERGADIILAFDASSDVHTGAAIRRIQNFAHDCHLELEDRTALFDLPDRRICKGTGSETEEKFLRQYARVFRGKRENKREVWVVYCPLLPHVRNPDFNPSVSAFRSLAPDHENEAYLAVLT